MSKDSLTLLNPWPDLPRSAPFVLPRDAHAIDAHNSKCEQKREFAFNIIDVLPEPFIGDVQKASVVILQLNPGFDPVADPPSHADDEFRKSLLANIGHKHQEWPFYYLNPEFRNHPGSIWWHRKLGKMQAEIPCEALAKRLAVIEWFPYKSTRFKPGKGVDSQDYSFSLVREAISRKALIILSRSRKLWEKSVPELSGYRRLLTLSSVQNVSLTPGNLLLAGQKSPAAWEMVLSALSG